MACELGLRGGVGAGVPFSWGPGVAPLSASMPDEEVLN